MILQKKAPEKKFQKPFIIHREFFQFYRLFKITIEETCKVCAEKADAKIITEWSGNTGSEYCDDYAVVDKQSILNCAELLKKEL